MEKIIPALKNLHKLAFGDSDLYIDLFFNKRFSQDDCFYITDDNGTPISVAYVRYFKCSLFGKIIDIPFLTGIATHPDHRYKSLASKVTYTAIDELTNRQLPFIMLHPFDTAFYQKLGFETINYAKEYTLKYVGDNKDISYRLLTNEDTALMHQLYNTYAKQHDFYRIRSEKDISEAWLEHTQDGGMGYLISVNNIPNSYIIAGNKKVFEYIGQNIEYLSCIKEIDKYQTTFLHTAGAPYSMATVGDINTLASTIPYQRNACGKYIVNIGDKNYIWQVSGGKLEKFAFTHKAHDFSLDKRALIAICLGNAERYSHILPAEFLAMFPSYNLYMYEKY